jgi:Trk-type K+ transport system membrane component
MKHEIWVREGQTIAHHFRISVIDTLVVNIKRENDSSPLQHIFTRLSGPQTAEIYNAYENTKEQRLCYLWRHHNWDSGVLMRTSDHWIPCRKTG